LAKCKGDKDKERELTIKLTDASIFVPAKPGKSSAAAKAKPKALGVASQKSKVIKKPSQKSKVIKKPSQKNKVIKKPSAVAKPVSVKRMTPGLVTIRIPPREADGERYMVVSLPHLGLGLKVMKVYTKTDLESKCKGDVALLEKLRAKLKHPALFQLLP